MTEQEKKQNREEYFKHCIEQEAKFIIMGQDPFPTEANGIPFCKDDIKQLEKSCFKTILKSLGIDWESIKDSKSTKCFFYDLAKNQKIVFVNLSNTLFKKNINETATPSKKIDDTINDNKEILDYLRSNSDSLTFIKIGKTHSNLFEKKYKEILKNPKKNKKYELLRHPSKNRINNLPDYKTYWSGDYLKKYWTQKN